MCEKVLIINDNDSQLQQLEDTLQTRLGYEVISARSSEDAMNLLVADNGFSPDFVLVDMARPEQEGLALLSMIRVSKPLLPVILLVPYGNDATMSQAFGMGVSDILIKPFWFEQLRLSIANVVAMQRMGQYISYLERKHNGRTNLADMVGNSAVMQQLRADAAQAAASSAPVWIEGEMGTGRELLAAAIHGESPRAGNPFIVIDCSDSAQGGLDKLLFGDGQRPGKLAEAVGGTVVLKNAGMLGREIQQQLVRAMQPGSSVNNVRFILVGTDTRHVANDTPSSTPTLLRQLCSHALSMPPLRERREDIPQIANHFARMYAASENKRIRSFSEAALAHLKQSAWHGNVRELMHLVWRAVLLASHECIEVGDIRTIQQLQPVHYENRQDSIANRTNPLLLDIQGRMKNLESIEKDVIQFALTYSGGCMTHAAKNLGIGRSTLYRRMHALKLDHYISRENQMTRPTMRMSSKAHS